MKTKKQPKRIKMYVILEFFFLSLSFYFSSDQLLSTLPQPKKQRWFPSFHNPLSPLRPNPSHLM